MAFILLCGVAGLAVSLNITFVGYGVVEPENNVLPRFCRMEKSTCFRVLDHPDARLLGIPNSLLGVAYYLALIAVQLLDPSGRFADLVRAAAWCSVAFGAYLSYSLVVRVRVRCQICLAAHLLNLVIALGLTWM